MSNSAEFNRNAFSAPVGLCLSLLGFNDGIFELLRIMIFAAPFCLALLGERVVQRHTVVDDAITAELSTDRTICFLILALSMIAVVIISCSTGIPTVMSPLPFLVVLPLITGLPPFAVAVISVMVFIAFLWPINQSYRGPIPPRATILLGIATALSAWWLIGGYSYGVQYEGLNYTVWVTIINLICIAGLWSLWRFLHRDTTFGWRMAFGTLLFWWLFWFAFPYLGEMP